MAGRRLTVAEIAAALRLLAPGEVGELVLDLWADEAGCEVLGALYDAANERGTRVEPDDGSGGQTRH